MFGKDDLNIQGRLTLLQYDRSGALVTQTRAHNDISTAGRRLVARLFNRDEPAELIPRVTRILVGGSQAPFDPTQSGLQALVGETTIERIETSEVPDAATGRPRVLLRLTGQLTEAQCNGELREAGLFTSEGIMYNRVTFDTITKSAEFRLTLVWEILF